MSTGKVTFIGVGRLEPDFDEYCIPESPVLAEIADRIHAVSELRHDEEQESIDHKLLTAAHYLIMAHAEKQRRTTASIYRQVGKPQGFSAELAKAAMTILEIAFESNIDLERMMRVEHRFRISEFAGKRQKTPTLKKREIVTDKDPRT